MNTLIALAANALFGTESEPLGHRPIDPDHAMLVIQNGNQVGNAVECLLPLLFHPPNFPVHFGASSNRSPERRFADVLLW